MIGQIVYIDGHAKSEQQSLECLHSCQKYDTWNVTRRKGITPNTVEKLPEFHWKLKTNSRLQDFKNQDRKKFLTKLSCVLNHVYFWRDVVEKNTPMCFLEHDAICVGNFDSDFDEYLLLNAEYAFDYPSILGSHSFKKYDFEKRKGVNYFSEKYPLVCWRDNDWKDSYMAPGTASYAITPKGAKRMLDVVEEQGLEQSDFLINSHNIKMQYVLPSPFKFNTKNLRTSHGF